MGEGGEGVGAVGPHPPTPPHPQAEKGQRFLPAPLAPTQNVLPQRGGASTHPESLSPPATTLAPSTKWPPCSSSATATGNASLDPHTPASLLGRGVEASAKGGGGYEARRGPQTDLTVLPRTGLPPRLPHAVLLVGPRPCLRAAEGLQYVRCGPATELQPRLPSHGLRCFLGSFVCDCPLIVPCVRCAAPLPAGEIFGQNECWPP